MAIFPYAVQLVQFSHSVVSDSLRPYGLLLPRLLCPWDSPSKDTGVGCHALLRGIFPTQGSNPGLLHCGQIHYCLSHQGSHLYTLLKMHIRTESESCSVMSNSLHNPMDCSPTGPSVHGILQARILEWVVIPFSRGSFKCKDGTWVSCTTDGFFTE